MFPAIVYSHHSVVGPGSGLFAFERGENHLIDLSPTAIESKNSAVRSAINGMLDQHEKSWKSAPTFSSLGVEYAVTLREGVRNGLWFPQRFAVDFLTDRSKLLERGRR
jgi:hypothetical protein